MARLHTPRHFSWSLLLKERETPEVATGKMSPRANTIFFRS
jgi:hypothetical protein